MPTWSIAAAQYGARPGDIDWNISHHLEFIRCAAEHRVDLLVFPELSLTGYELALAPQLAMSIHDPRLDVFTRAAHDAQMTIVIGLPLSTGQQVLLSALAFLPEGTRMAYGKRNLFGDEKRIFQPGESLPLFGYARHQVAMAICADIKIEEFARDASERGADLYATGMLLSREGYAEDSAHLARWAQQFSMTVLMANYALPTGGYQSAGKSAVWDESGRQIVVGGADEEVVIARREGHHWQGEVHPLPCLPES
ncbi:carbon-nitrogen hydrolase family protein [Erwinia sp. 9145]|uniref:carbon-nitrogen hydrolase family protein n=1 Tax=Erwinia sp. 9145 TaxID=1500895 RepID=UPI0005564AAC|nr:carbon-nitrogen hydrolase family protein [Erwinia sp. 9145]